MKHFLSLVFLATGILSAAASSYPDIYLRGACNGWGVDDNYKFSREGNLYTLSVPYLDGEFKIADSSWGEVDFGAQNRGDALSHDASLTLKKKGENILSYSLSNVNISFRYEPGDNEITIYTDSEAPVTPDRPVTGMSGTLPVLYINVYEDDSHSRLNNEIISKDLNHKNYFSSAEYWLDTNGCQWLIDEGAENLGSKEEPLPLEIKARGNYTRTGFSKKPFKLKLGKKASMLGMSKSKHYAILAHADDDKGYLRNFTGFLLGKRIGLPWTPSMQPVEVVINGDYRGLYFLTESIRVEEDRINITELADNETDPSLISGGYLVELDNYDEDNQIRMQEKTCISLPRVDVLRITFDTPEEYSDIQREFVTEQFSAMNDTIGRNDDQLWDYMDLEDAAKYYVVEEIISHYEAYHGSTYLFRDFGENQKWHFSPLWDCGNAFNAPTDDFFYNHGTYGNTWIPSMRCNATFNTKVKEVWMRFMREDYPGVEDEITIFTNHIAEAAKADRKRWDGQPVPNGGQGVADNSDIASRRRGVLDHLHRKTEWLKSQFGDYSAAVEIVTAPDETPVYYNLQGVRVENPAGGIFIEHTSGGSRKVLIP